jgi:hypothetical protein
MNELGLSQVELAARCARTAGELFSEDHQKNITRERIAKILMHCKANPGKSAARVISPQELQVLSSVLQVSSEWLGGQDDGRGLVLWDPLAGPHRAKHILHLMNEHDDQASEILVWAEYLICSFETPEFMHKHHEALFTELDMLGAHDEKRRLVNVYDSIGNARRKRLLDPKRKRCKLVQFIFASDLERIAQGKGEYAGISKQLRRECLANVLRLTSDEALGIELVIIDSGDADGIRTAFRDYDSVGVFDESFVLWRYHSGRIAWSEDSAHAKRCRGMLQELRKQRGSLTGIQTLKLIKRLAESVG